MIKTRVVSVFHSSGHLQLKSMCLEVPVAQQAVLSCVCNFTAPISLPGVCTALKTAICECEGLGWMLRAYQNALQFLCVPACLTSSVITLSFGLFPQLHCPAVNHTSVKLEPFLDLSLEHERATSVEDALRLFTATEKLEGTTPTTTRECTWVDIAMSWGLWPKSCKLLCSPSCGSVYS